MYTLMPLLLMTVGTAMTSPVAGARPGDDANATVSVRSSDVFGSDVFGSDVRSASSAAVALPARRRAQSSFPMWSMTVDENIVVGGGSSAHWVEALSWVGEGYPGLFVGTDFDFATCGSVSVRHDEQGFLFLKMRR